MNVILGGFTKICQHIPLLGVTLDIKQLEPTAEP